MEVSLPISAAVKPEPARAAAVHGPAATAPSVALPLRFMIAGLLAFISGVVWLIAQPGILATYHYNQAVIAVTHLFVLGWICTIVMGAMYQLVPVALETRLYSERLAKWQFVFHVIGFVGMVWMFRVWNLKQVGHFGSVLGVGVFLFAYNIFRTLLRVPKWSVVASSVSTALGWIILTILAGLSIAAAKSGFDPDQPVSSGLFADVVQRIGKVVGRFDTIGAMHAHAHLGAIGFFTMLIAGVSYKLVPMFTLSEVQSRRRAVASIVLLNIGLVGAFVSILLRSPWKPAFAGILIIGLLTYGWELVAIVKARKRGPLDWGMKYFLTAITMLVPVSTLGLVLSWPGLPPNPFTGQLENVYGFLGLIGFVSFAMMGMLYKIIPFLVWFATYSRHIGRAKVPALAEMYSARLQMLGYWSFLAGLAVASIGAARGNTAPVRVGCVLLGFTVACQCVNVGSMLLHYWKPRILPFTPRPAGISVKS